MKEIEIGNVKQMSRTGGALVAKNATALSAMMTPFKDRELDVAIKIITCSSERIRLPEAPWQ
jgi:hypothetical protein